MKDLDGRTLMRLARIASRRALRGYSSNVQRRLREDAVGESVIAMMRVASRYDADLGVSLGAWLVMNAEFRLRDWLRGELREGLVAGWTKSKPRVESLERACESIGLGRNLPYTLRRAGAHGAVRRFEQTSLSEEHLHSEQPGPFEIVAERRLRQSVRDSVATLPKQRDQAVLAMRFGFEADDGEGLTLKQCGRGFGVTPEVMRQQEARGLRGLRHQSRAEKLRGWLE